MLTSSHPRSIVCFVAFVLVVAAGCCALSPVPVSHAHYNGPANEIPWVEIQPNLWRLTTAGDIVRALRPNMLLPRKASALHLASSLGPTDGGGIQVYVDGFRIGGLEVLERIPARAVLTVRRLTPSEATTRYGSGHTNVVIAVTMHPNAAR